MPNAATGSIRWRDGIPSARVTLQGKDRVVLAMPACTTEAAAAERANLLATIAKRLRGIATREQAIKALELVASVPPEARSLRNALAVVDELAGGELVPKGMRPEVLTFRALGEQWTKGELAERHPDQLRVKRSADSDTSRLEKHVYPVIGDLQLDAITLDHCEEVMRRLPEKLSPASRRHVGQLVARVLAIAVYPLRIIARSPIPAGFLPSNNKRKALAHLYPNEELQLMGCVEVPLAYRLLWGFLAREGMREGEALALTWADFDLERGAVRLDKNKTDDPRAWPLSPGVAAALRRVREQRDPKPNDLVFLDPEGAELVAHRLAGLLRDHLRMIGLEAKRPELFTTTDERRRIRVHDLRGTFVTIALANGRSETWIGDRTGHRSSQMIARYKRQARTFEELHVGELAPLDVAIPELRAPVEADGPPKDHGGPSEAAGASDAPSANPAELQREKLVGHLGFEPRANGLRSPRQHPEDGGNAAFSGDPQGASQRSEAGDRAGGPSVVHPDPVERALADALARASAAGEWSVVARLAGELEARRAARADVVDLATERRKRGGGAS